MEHRLADLTYLLARIGAMAPSLETLPQELLDEIIHGLDFSDSCRLAECSQRLNFGLRNILYTTAQARNDALLLACNFGLPNVLCSATAAGASPSTAQLRIYEASGRCRTLTVLTLHQAAQSGHGQVFRLLLRLGAGVTAVPIEEQRDFFDRLCGQPHLDFAGLFLESGLVSQLPQESIDEFMIALIKSRPEVHMVKRLLDLGANPNYVSDWQSGRPTMSPLSAAVLEGLPDIASLLLDRGAQVNGPDYDCSVSFPFHLPLYALLHETATSDVAHFPAELDRLQTYIDGGADVNYRAPVTYDDGRWGRRGSRWFHATPLLFYLNHMCQFSPDAVHDHKTVIQMLVSRGTSVLPLPDRPSDRVLQRNKAFSFIRNPTPIQLLLESWGIQYLEHPGFLDILCYLICCGAAAAPNIGSQLAKCEETCLAAAPLLIPSWKHFVARIAEAQPSHESLNRILRQYVMCKASPRTAATSEYVSELTFDTLDALLAAPGADINWRDPGHDDCTALQQLCRNFRGLEQHPVHGQSLPHWWMVFFGQMLARGADPGLEWEGMTAREILVEGWEGYTDQGRKWLGGLLEVIEGWERGKARERECGNDEGLQGDGMSGDFRRDTELDSDWES